MVGIDQSSPHSRSGICREWRDGIIVIFYGHEVGNIIVIGIFPVACACKTAAGLPSAIVEFKIKEQAGAGSAGRAPCKINGGFRSIQFSKHGSRRQGKLIKNDGTHILCSAAHIYRAGGKLITISLNIPVIGIT